MKMFYPFLFLFLMPILCIGQDLNYEIIQENVSCYGEADGIIQIVIDEDPDLYTFLWSNGSTFSIISDLSPGTYSATISDAAGEVVEVVEVEITQPEEMYGIISNTQINCASAATPYAIMYGGNGSFTFSWSTGSTEESIIVDEIGEYEVTVTDIAGCQWIKEFFVNEDKELPKVNAGEDIYLTCKDENMVELFGETNEDFIFLFVNWSTEDGIVIGPHNELNTVVAPGTYYFWVRHPISLCEATDTVTVYYDESFDYEIETNDVACFGSASGSAELLIDEEATTSIVWSTGEITKEIENLPAGSYIAMIQYENCEKTDTFSISQPEAALEVGSSTIYNGDGSATIELDITGGWGDEAIVWYFEGEIIGEEIDTMLVHNTGNYTISVLDAGGCEVETSTFVDLMTSNNYTANKPSLKVHPNPAMNYFILEGMNTIDYKEINILDYTGNIVKKIPAPYNDTFNIDFLSSGAYLIQIKYVDGTSQIIKFSKI